MKTADDFLKDMETDENLMAKFTEVFDKTVVESEQARIDLIVQFACDNGYGVSVEDLTRSFSGKQKLDEGELDLVAGGREQCLALYSCPMLLNTCAISNECTDGYSCHMNIQ